MRKIIAMQPGILRIGTSNIVLPGSKQSFPVAFRDKPRLTYYASLFNSLEVNSTFYKTPQAKTVARWSAEVGPDFQFSVKLSKQITHAKNLQYNPEEVVQFMHTLQLPAAQTGCLLVQFPGKITMDYFKQVAGLLSLLAKNNRQARWRIAVEFRHPSWYNDKVYALLDNWRAALVLHDIPASQQLTVHTAADFVYRRFHGIAGDYRGSYPETVLDAVSDEVNALLNAGKDVYLYFNNTIGDAFANAKHLQL